MTTDTTQGDAVKYSEWAESFTIFAKYGDGSDVNAQHDEMWAGPQPSDVSPEDTARLTELGWRGDDDGGFHRFV